MTQFDLDKLFDSYKSIVVGPYKKALVDASEFHPPKIDPKEATVIDAAEYVSEAAAHYGMVSHLAACARAAADLAEAKYKLEYKAALIEADGKNAEARDAAAQIESQDEYEEMIFYKSASVIFNSLEQTARTTADSSRKIAEMIQSHHISELGNKHS